MVRIVNISHSTRTAILQLVDPACPQEHVETRIWNFHFLSVAARAHIGRFGR